MSGEIELCPTEIRFMHYEVNERFGTRYFRGDDVNEVIEKITQGLMNVYDLPKIRVVRLEEKNNYYYAFDNRRLYVYRTLHLRGKLDKVKVKLAHSNLFQPRRFNTLNNGKSVKLNSRFCIDNTLPHSHAVSPPPSPTSHRSADEPATSSSFEVDEPVSEAVAATITSILETVLAAVGDKESQTNTHSNDIGQEISAPAVPVFNFQAVYSEVADEEISENTAANSSEDQENAETNLSDDEQKQPVSKPSTSNFKLALVDDYLIEASQQDAEIRTIVAEKNLTTFAEKSIGLGNTEQNEDDENVRKLEDECLLNSAEAIDLKTVMEVGREDVKQQNEKDTNFEISEKDSIRSSNSIF